MSEIEAGRVALAEGSLWLARNEDTLSEIRATKICTRWKDWFDRPDFRSVHQAILRRADEDMLFADRLANDARSLAERKMKRGESIPDGLVQHSQRYIEEEMAVFAIQSAVLPAAEIYPGSNLSAAEYLLSKALERSNERSEPQPTLGLLQPLTVRHFTRIDFDRVNVSPGFGVTPQARLG
jgi:hypothetical protein